MFGFIDAEYDDYDAGTVKFNGKKTEQTPSHTLRIGAAYTSALILGVFVVWLVCEMIHRLLHPKMLQPLEAFVVGGAG